MKNNIWDSAKEHRHNDVDSDGNTPEEREDKLSVIPIWMRNWVSLRLTKKEILTNVRNLHKMFPSGEIR